MTNIFLADVTVHVDESMQESERLKLENDLRSTDGVVSVHFSEKTPHLVVVTYDPDHAKSKDVLKVVLGEHLHAELVGI
jgi:hypothetical protein